MSYISNNASDDQLTVLLNKLYIKYSYIENIEKYTNKVLKNIRIYIDQFDGEQIDYNKLLEKMDSSLLKLLSEDFKNSEFALKITNSFIENNISVRNKYNENVNEFSKLIKFFSIVNYSPDFNFIVSLFNFNAKLSNLFNMIYKSRHILLKAYDLFDVFEDEYLSLFMEIYCNLNNLELCENDLLEENVKLNKLDHEPLGDEVRIYLNEIGKIPLLTPNEERNLATEIDLYNKKINEIDNNINNSNEKNTILELEKEKKKMQKKLKVATDKLAEANLRLVVSIAKRYTGRGVHLLDLIQAGNIGLIKSVEKYDVYKGFKFSTYATWWIRQSIQRELAYQGSSIHIPFRTADALNKINYIRKVYTMELGRMPTLQELSERANIPLEKMEDLLKIKRDSISLSTPITGSDDATLGDFIPSESNNEYNEVLNNMASENLIEIMLEALNQTEFEVLLYRFGLNNCNVRTLESIAKDRNLSRERIRQIEFRAIRKLQNPKYKRKLKGLLDGH